MGKKVKLLVVEDDPNISTILVELLTENNYDVTLANDGMLALELLEKQRFDLILLDEMLPSMLGSEILIRIRANTKRSNVPVIMMTSLKDYNHQVSVLRDGADDYIQKPFRYNVLMARLQSVIRRSNISSTSLVEIPDGIAPEAISPKEKEVLKLVVKGYNNPKIADLLFISENTVSNHVKSILSKLKSDSRTQAAIIALKLNIV